VAERTGDGGVAIKELRPAQGCVCAFVLTAVITLALEFGEFFGGRCGRYVKEVCLLLSGWRAGGGGDIGGASDPVERENGRSIRCWRSR